MPMFKTTDGTEIYYNDWGTGPAIMFHHGWPLSADDWDAQMMFFLAKGYRVHGVSRDASRTDLSRLARLGVLEQMPLHSADLAAPRGGFELIEALRPDEIYNLSGQSSAGHSFAAPQETFDSIAAATVNLLEALRALKRPVRLFQAASSDCFGDSQDPLHEDSPLRPRSPYAVAKASAYWASATWRDAYGLHVCSGILANHESPLRPSQFVTGKIVRAAVDIARGGKERLTLGDTSVGRDWGWAPEYVQAMWLCLQHETPGDYVIATGETNRLSDLVAAIFESLRLDWREHVDIDESLFRPGEPQWVKLDPSRAHDLLGWSARSRMRDVARQLVAGVMAGELGPAPWIEGALPDLDAS